MKTATAAASLALFAVAAHAQAKPPMKMGLWESESQTKMNMPDAPAFMVGMMNRTVHVRSCITPESYQKAWVTSQQQKDCVRSNEGYNERSMSFDMTCNKGKMTTHTQIDWDSETSGHGTVHMVMEGGHSNMTGDSVVTTHWVSADCGSVTPDKPVFVK